MRLLDLQFWFFFRSVFLRRHLNWISGLPAMKIRVTERPEYSGVTLLAARFSYFTTRAYTRYPDVLGKVWFLVANT